MLDGGDASTAQVVAANFFHSHRPHTSRMPRTPGMRDRAKRRPHYRNAGSIELVVVAICIASIATFVGAKAASGAPRVHLRGIARIDAHVARAQGKLVLRGTVTDDVGASVEHARIAVQISTERLDGHARPVLLALTATAPAACSDVWTAPVLDGTDRVLLAADAAARFCLRLALPAGRFLAHLEADSAGFVDGARIDLPVDLALEPVTLRFDPEMTALSLDSEAVPLDALATTEDDGLTAPAANLPLALSNETGRALGNATTDTSGRARFVVAGPLFGPAGQGELRVSFAGSAQAGATSHSMTVERRAHVELAVPQAIDGRLPLAWSEQEIALRVVAKTACASRGCAGTPTGTVEVRLGDGDASRVIGAAAIVGGEARVVVTLASQSDDAGDVLLRLEYVPDAPWFEASGALPLTQPLHPPSAWNKIVLVISGLTVIGWLGIGRLPRRSGGRESSAGGIKIAESPASVEVVSPGAAGAQRWTGRIVDGHDGAPVSDARVAVERPGFDRAEIVASATADAEGAFVLAPVGIQPGDHLVAEGALHTLLRVSVPPFGEIRVALVSRRRALLERLVGWARRKGRPYDARPEPTPGHVQRMSRSGEPIRAWAEAVERAAYSGDAIDAAREAEVDRLAPGDPSPARGAGKT
jgi:hypothetical protein